MSARYIVERTKPQVRHVKSPHDFVPLCASLVRGSFWRPFVWVESRSASTRALPLCGRCEASARRIARDGGVL